MRMDGNTVLITGGATGIGFSMAKLFRQRGSVVIICSRREDRLAQAARELSGIHTIKCDVADSGSRNELFRRVNGNFPEVNILVNNAGVQRDIDLVHMLLGGCSAEAAPVLVPSSVPCKDVKARRSGLPQADAATGCFGCASCSPLPAYFAV